MPVRESRCLFGPWLLQQINSNQYEGVSWLDDRRTLFRLPWKHLNIRNVDERDYAIFKAWAIQSGKYNKVHEDLPSYKTNFRCALKSVSFRDGKMFSERKDNSSDPRDPHKIFAFHGVHDDSCRAVEPSTASQTNMQADQSLQEEMEHDEDYRLRISPHHEPNGPFSRSQESDDLEQLLRNVLLNTDENGAHDVLEILQDEYSQDIPRVDQVFAEPLHEPNLALAERYTNGHEQHLPNNHIPFFNEQCPQYQGYDLYQNGQIQNLPVDQSFQQMQNFAQLQQATTVYNFVAPQFNDAQTCQYGFQPAGTQHMMNNEVPNHSPNYACNTNREASQSPQDDASTFHQHGMTESHETGVTLVQPASKVPKLTSWEATVFYRGKEVLKQNVSTKFYINYTGHVPRAEAADVVSFPSTADTLVNHLQIQFTDEILNSVGNGLCLDVSPEDCKLYATRMGNSRVYWGMSESLESKNNASHTKKLDRDVPTEIFDFNQFIQELRDYKCQKRSSPDYTLYLSFGQSLFDPIKKLLVLVKLVPHFCSYWHQIAQQEGASSLHNELLSLQISNGNSFNNFDGPDLMELDLAQLHYLF